MERTVEPKTTLGPDAPNRGATGRLPPWFLAWKQITDRYAVELSSPYAPVLPRH
jgi:hypothetical protein